jgi:homoserine dehydrogenase
VTRHPVPAATAAVPSLPLAVAPAPTPALPAAIAPPASDAFRSSGQSPGVRTVHLVGCGHVGRSFLGQLAAASLPARVVAVSDSTATVFDRSGLQLDAIAAHKRSGAPLARWPRAEAVPTELAIRVVAADVVVDATPSTVADTAAAVARGRAALRHGAFLVLSGKNALAAAAAEWLLGSSRGRVGVHAVLGGAGQALVRELDELRARCTGIAAVGNVTTTVIVDAIERGASLDEGIAAARARGLLEPDPTLDLDGSDAATKLRAVWTAVFGQPGNAPGAAPPAAHHVVRDDVRALDVALLRERAARGATTRLVARGGRAGGLRVRFEEVARSSPLAAPPDRVVYGYALPDGLRLHVGDAVGFDRTAAALLADCRDALRDDVRTEVRP